MELIFLESGSVQGGHWFPGSEEDLAGRLGVDVFEAESANVTSQRPPNQPTSGSEEGHRRSSNGGGQVTDSTVVSEQGGTLTEKARQIQEGEVGQYR